MTGGQRLIIRICLFGMMSTSIRIAVFLMSLTAIINGCKKGNRCTPASFYYSFQENKQLDTVRITNPPDAEFIYYQVPVRTGNNLVFKYNHIRQDCPEIMDDEGMRSIWFEIPGNADNFIYRDSAELMSSKCIVSLSCECYPYLPVMIKAGSIEGHRLSQRTWKVKADLLMPWGNNDRVQFDHIFTIE